MATNEGIRELLDSVTSEHPLPWKIETDSFGDVYVVDANGIDLEFDRLHDRALLKLVVALVEDYEQRTRQEGVSPPGEDAETIQDSR